ncbi:MAG: tetratricopeptide repeat protein [Promethearchaeota archaeon]
MLFSSSIKFSEEIAQSEDYFDAGEFLYSAAEILEDIDFSKAQDLYKRNIKLWEKLIENLIIQAKLHEIAEIYLRIAELYSDKLHNLKLEHENILKGIKYLKEECKLFEAFSETRKLAQNYQNIADLYLKLSDFRNAILFYEEVINISKIHNYYDMLSFSYQQIVSCYEELDDYTKSKEILLEGVDFFSELFHKFEEKNENLALAQICQILKNLYSILNDKEQIINYSKKEAGAYINLAERLDKKEKNFQKIARYYRGAGLCYQEIHNNLIECASCFVLAGNYNEKIDEFNEAALNFFDAANLFKELNNFEMAYKHFVKAGDNFWKLGNLNQSTESYLNAYDIAVEKSLEFNRFGIFNQIVRGLSKIAKEGLKNKQFYTAATLILESIKFYEQLDIAKDVFLREMVRNVYKYYYRAANLKKIGTSHIVHSYVLASLSSILNGKLDKAQKIMSEIDFEGKTINEYKEIIKIIIEWVSEGTPVRLENLSYRLKRLIEGSEEIMYLLNLFKSLQPPPSLISQKRTN